MVVILGTAFCGPLQKPVTEREPSLIVVPLMVAVLTLFETAFWDCCCPVMVTAKNVGAAALLAPQLVSQLRVFLPVLWERLFDFVLV